MAKKFSDLFDMKKPMWGGLTLPLFAIMVLVTILVIFTTTTSTVDGKEVVKLTYLRPNFLVMLSLLAVIGIVIGEIGDRIPIWNDYVGGGTVLVFFASACIGTYKLVPAPFLKNIETFYNKQPVNFLELFIPALIVGSILTVNRKMLIKSIVGYIPLILIGVVGASAGGILMGLVFGKSPIDIMMNYVLPIMGGGTGAGAIPMSEMWESATGRPASEWFAFAISILTIANIIAIFTGAFLKELGKKIPSLTGNGELVMGSREAVKEEEEKVEGGIGDVAAAMFLTGILFCLANILAIMWKKLPTDFEMHRLAFLVILTIILNVTGIVPAQLRGGAKKMQTFFSKYTVWILMVAVGVSTDVKEIRDSLTLGNLLIAMAIVFGACLFIMAVAKAMKFYPVEAAITAGLCMANRGGSGDIAVLGAADRMELMSFAQISSRIGGAMMLMIATAMFGMFA